MSAAASTADGDRYNLSFEYLYELEVDLSCEPPLKHSLSVDSGRVPFGLVY